MEPEQSRFLCATTSDIIFTYIQCSLLYHHQVRITFFGNFKIFTALSIPFLFLLLLPKFFYFSTANVIFPETISHLFYIGFMVTSLVFEFVTGIFFAGGLGNFWIIVFLAMDIVKKWFDWKAVVKLLSTTHVILTDNNVYYWMLNYFTFGILGTWPLVRPDFFQRIEDLYCAYWSC